MNVSNAPGLHVQGLSAGYGGAPVLQDVNLQVAPGEVLALLGRNGSGRSTLARALMGLIPASGHMWWQGQPLHGLPPHQRARAGVGYVSESRDVFPRLSVRHNLLLGEQPGQRHRPEALADMLALFPALARRLHLSQPALFDRFAAFRSGFMSLVGNDGALDLYEGRLRARDADGAPIFDAVDPSRYWDVLTEEVRPWSYMKFPYIKSLGPAQGWYKVGPLARVQNCDRLPTPRAEAARQEFLAHGGGAPLHATLAYHWARMIEMLMAAEMIRDLLDDPDITGTELMAHDSPGRRAERGVGVIEAPRGTLIHHYRVNDDDQVVRANLIVSTTHNNQAMNEAIRAVARSELDGRTLTEALLNRIEVAIRAFDPCLSCATHALGRMPLALELLDAQGNVVDRLSRDSRGRSAA